MTTHSRHPKVGSSSGRTSVPNMFHRLSFQMTGQYIYFESSTPKRARAVLSSPLIKARQGCLQFSYHMWGDRRMGQLRLVKISRGVSKVLWKASGNKGNRWHRHSISIQNGIPYTVNFFFHVHQQEIIHAGGPGRKV